MLLKLRINLRVVRQGLVEDVHGLLDLVLIVMRLLLVGRKGEDVVLLLVLVELGVEVLVLVDL